MAGTPSGPPGERRAGEDRGGEGDRGDGRHERYGPLEVDRRVKDDGRALILYSRTAREKPHAP